MHSTPMLKRNNYCIPLKVFEDLAQEIIEDEPSKFYNFETLFRSVKDALRKYLQDNGIYYELSSCFQGWHFEVKLTISQLEKANAFLDSISITEVK